MPTTESQPPDELLLTTSVPPATDMLTTQRVDVEPAEATSACNLPSCFKDAVNRGLCEVHWSTHRGLADPEDETPEVEAPEQDEEVSLL